MTLLSAPRLAGPVVTTESGLLVPAGIVDRDAVGGGGGSLIFESDFDEVSNTALEDHTPTTGESWVKDGTGTDWSVHGNGITVRAGNSDFHLTTSSTTCSYRLPTIMASADVDITVTIYFAHSTDGNIGVYFRAPDLNDRTGYYVGSAGGDKLALIVYDPSEIDKTYLYLSADKPLSTWYTLRVKAVGTNFTMWVDDIGDGDTPVYEGTDSDFTAAGYYHARIRPYTNNYCGYIKITEL